MDIEERAEELASDLGVEHEAVHRDLENLLEYSVPIDEAVESLRRKYGTDEPGSQGPSTLEIQDISTERQNVTVTVVVLTVGKRSIFYDDEERVIREGTVADETGTIAFTSWNEFTAEPGDTITVMNASVREWEGNPELNIGDNTTIEPASDSLSVPYEVGGETKLLELDQGDRGRTITVRVEEVEERTIDGRDGQTTILSGVFSDDTARLPFTDWDPHTEIAEGETVRIENVYVQEYRGAPSINLSEFSTVTPVDTEFESPGSPKYSIREARDTNGAYDITVRGHLVGIQDGSGLIQRCPECGRLVQKGRCRQHGEVEAIDDLRTKAILDDGTSVITVILGTELTEEIYGGDVSAARAEAEEKMDQEVVMASIRDDIVGREFEVRGHVNVDEYGATMTGTAFESVDSDPTEAANELLEAVRE